MHDQVGKISTIAWLVRLDVRGWLYELIHFEITAKID